jgi:hypothetical protein
VEEINHGDMPKILSSKLLKELVRLLNEEQAKQDNEDQSVEAENATSSERVITPGKLGDSQEVRAIQGTRTSGLFRQIEKQKGQSSGPAPTLQEFSDPERNRQNQQRFRDYLQAQKARANTRNLASQPVPDANLSASGRDSQCTIK